MDVDPVHVIRADRIPKRSSSRPGCSPRSNMSLSGACLRATQSSSYPGSLLHINMLISALIRESYRQWTMPGFQEYSSAVLSGPARQVIPASRLTAPAFEARLSEGNHWQSPLTPWKPQEPPSPKVQRPPGAMVLQQDLEEHCLCNFPSVA